MKIYASIKSLTGKTVKLGDNSTLEIDIMIGNNLFERLIIKHESGIVEPMNYTQSINGYTLSTAEGKRLSYILDKR